MSDKNVQIELINSMQNAREDGRAHLPYSKEMGFYDLVREGEIEALEKLDPQLLVEGQGVLSSDKIRNCRYHFIIATAFITRFCIEGGMDKEEAYTLSDLYIQKMDKMSEMDEIKELHHTMVFDYAKKMRAMKKNTASSMYIRKTIDFISNNLNRNIMIGEIAEYLGLSEKYLSSLFKKETKQTIVSYIEQRKMEAASQMLIYTENSFAQIADSLCYCSQSYFSKIFKKYYKLTPLQYRLKYANQKFLK